MAEAAAKERSYGLFTKITYGIGAAADGVKNNGFEYFLLFFYSQVLGVDAPLAGLALLLAMVVDGFSDPIVGYWSDNLRTRFGRRHPFMYAAAIPAAIAFYFVWNPPSGLQGNELFPYLLLMTILVRICFTFYEVPSMALVPEMTDNYDERTSFLSFRYVSGWVGGLTIACIALLFFLVPTETCQDGWFNVEGYQRYGFWAAVMITGAILICSLGTHPQIPRLKAPPPARKLTLRRVFGEIGESLSNRSFIGLFLSALFGFMAAGIAASLNYYINSLFWEFTPQQVFVLTAAVFLSAAIALFFAPFVSKRLGKKRGAIIVGIIAFSVAPAPVVARLFGLMPENGTQELFNLILVITIFDVAMIITNQILAASMIADIVEQSELKTGRRSEGIFFAGITFIRKVSRGVGILLASFVLGIAGFATPRRSCEGVIDPGVSGLSEASVPALGAGYAIGLLAVWTLTIACLFLYRIRREDHEANLAALEEKRQNNSV